MHAFASPFLPKGRECSLYVLSPFWVLLVERRVRRSLCVLYRVSYTPFDPMRLRPRAAPPLASPVPASTPLGVPPPRRLGSRPAAAVGLMNGGPGLSTATMLVVRNVRERLVVEAAALRRGVGHCSAGAVGHERPIRRTDTLETHNPKKGTRRH